MKVLILGGTGAMGVHLVNLLSKQECEITVTSRSRRKSKDNIEYIQGNARDVDFLQTTILNKKWDVIIDFMVYSTPLFKERAELLLQATSQYVFLSSARVYADSKEPIKENSSRLLDVSQDEVFLSLDEYSLTKARQEDILKNSGRSNWTIIRPYITYAENRLQLGVLEKEEWLYRALKGRTIFFSEDINSKFTTLTYGHDVAKGIVSIIGNKEALGEAFHIATNETITWGCVLNIYLNVLKKHLGYEPKVVLKDLESYNNVESHKIYQIKYDRMFDRKFDNSKISKHYKDSFISIEQGLKNSLLVFLENPQFNHINWKSEALKDKATKEHTKLKEIPRFKQKVKYLLYRYFL